MDKRTSDLLKKVELRFKLGCYVEGLTMLAGIIDGILKTLIVAQVKMLGVKRMKSIEEYILSRNTGDSINIAYMMGIIAPEMYPKLREFNTLRNKVIKTAWIKGPEGFEKNAQRMKILGFEIIPKLREILDS